MLFLNFNYFLLNDCGVFKLNIRHSKNRMIYRFVNTGFVNENDHYLVLLVITLMRIMYTYLTNAVISTPAVTNIPPSTLPSVGFSPKNTNARITVRATESLSMGATRDASPNWSAL